MRWRDLRTSPAEGIACASSSDRSNTGKRRGADRVGRQVAGLAGMRSALPLPIPTLATSTTSHPFPSPPAVASVAPTTSLFAHSAVTFAYGSVIVAISHRACLSSFRTGLRTSIRTLDKKSDELERLSGHCENLWKFLVRVWYFRLGKYMVESWLSELIVYA